ncbi:DarT ssDNA thymidine ADP-ribosyltransferase family protein [Clostridium paraputrificum]|uniref:DarT ssDNA thymidine ADP-ribosyltransferase family protein n=1 Tax=Clostridium paraputrificum TaxID=29363 RepID=UPI003D35248A
MNLDQIKLNKISEDLSNLSDQPTLPLISKEESLGIKDFCKFHHINSLFHFTSINNLESILTYGLLPLNLLKEGSINFSLNDSKRFDSMSDSVSASLQFPCYKSLNRLREENPNKKWVILQLKSSILWDLNSFFYPDSAINFSNDSRIFNNLDALKRLFTDNLLIERKNLNIPPNYPTNPSSETLIKNKISINYIGRVWFDITDYDTMNFFYNKYKSKVGFALCHKYFSDRKDGFFWNEQ